LRSKVGAKKQKKGLLEFRLINLEQAQVMGLQRSHVEIRDEMTGIREQLNTFMQMMQINNL